jgi:hypothetical protein
MTGFMGGPMLAELLDQRTRAALDALARLDADVLLSENLDVLVHGLLAEHMPQPVSVDWTAPSSTPIEETSIERNVDDFGYMRKFHVAASRITITWPLTGTAELLRRHAARFMLMQHRGTIKDDGVQLQVEAQDLSADHIDRQIEELREEIDKRIGWANDDLQTRWTTADHELRRAAEGRRARITENRRISAVLNIPIVPTGAKRQPVPAQRRQVPLEQRRASAEFIPEPVLDQAIYQEILDVVENWAKSLERTCTPPIRALGEETLRDLLLGTLNGHWKGAAAGELFNGAGKTDILIRENGRNVFIAECKVWGGAARATDALDQLLSYLVWRDTKAALIVFVKNVNSTEIIDRLHEAVHAHPRHLITVGATDAERRGDYVFTAEDDERRIELAVIPVVLPDTGAGTD